MNIAKYLRELFLIEHFQWLLLHLLSAPPWYQSSSVMGQVSKNSVLQFTKYRMPNNKFILEFLNSTSVYNVNVITEMFIIKSILFKTFQRKEE